MGVFILWRRQTPRTAFGKSHFWRSAMGTVSLVASFYAMTELPLALAITLNYTSPIWLTILSALVLKERFRPRLLLAIALGFVGVVAGACSSFSSSPTATTTDSGTPEGGP
ncbi:MAG: DMT family transporter, partial [Usitatibacteraceae bacterium]